jgi:hypothetical protein
LVRVQSRLPNKSALLGGEEKGESKDSPFLLPAILLSAIYVFCRCPRRVGKPTADSGPAAQDALPQPRLDFIGLNEIIPVFSSLRLDLFP